MSDVATSAPPEVVRNYPRWNCEFVGQHEGITVGQTWELACHGDSGLKPPLSLQFPSDEMAYTLHILNIKNFDNDGATFEVTSYKAGNFSPPYVVLTDGASAVKIEGLHWKVGSVLKPQAQGQQQQQPYPPYGPYYLPMPWWYWAILGGGLLFVVLIAAILWRLQRRRRREREVLQKLESSLTPGMELHRDIRKYMKEINAPETLLRPLSKTFRVYLSRKFKFLAMEMSRHQILGRLKKTGKLKDSLAVDNFLTEIDRALEAPKRFSTQDAEQLLNSAREIADKLEKIK